MSRYGKNDGLMSAGASNGEHITVGGVTGLTASSERVPLKVASDGTLAVSGGSSVATERANSSGLAASLIIKASAGTLYDLRIYNNKASLQYFQIFDSATVPADTAVPLFTYPVSATTAFGDSFQNGMVFENGIVVCNSSTAETKTIGAADCLFAANYE